MFFNKKSYLLQSRCLSSLPSVQSSFPSHSSFWAIHCELLHRNSSISQSGKSDKSKLHFRSTEHEVLKVDHCGYQMYVVLYQTSIIVKNLLLNDNSLCTTIPILTKFHRNVIWAPLYKTVKINMISQKYHLGGGGGGLGGDGILWERKT